VGLVTTKELLSSCSRDWAVGAFNINNLDDIQAVINAGEELQSPVILQVSEGVAKHIGVELVAAICCTAGNIASIPVAVHLDHCHSASLAIQCMRHGFTSVMIDGSSLPFEENVALTKQVVEVARLFGASVEGELGRVGGTEDDLVVDDASLTVPEEAARFVELTGIDVLAPSIGTLHGTYKAKPHLDFERLQTISERVPVPLALHGGSGLTEEQFKECIRHGIAKINIGTDIKKVQIAATRHYLENNPNKAEPRPLSKTIQVAVSETVKEKIRLFGSMDKAMIWGFDASKARGS
jgi:ketose-bisphosphate aldolase